MAIEPEEIHHLTSKPVNDPTVQTRRQKELQGYVADAILHLCFRWKSCDSEIRDDFAPV